MGQIESKQQDDRLKPYHINNYIKVQWPRYLSQKAQIVILDQKEKPSYMQLHKPYFKHEDRLTTRKKLYHGNTDNKKAAWLC